MITSFLLQWLKGDFLDYLTEWEHSVESRTNCTKAQKLHMCLSRETLEGWRITGWDIKLQKKHCMCIDTLYCYSFAVRSFVDLTQYLLSHPGAEGKFFLSERLTQDPLENYFGKQHSKGGRSDNPTAKQCLQNAASLRLQGSLALDPIRGNCRQKRRLFAEETVDSTPLPKRSRGSKT